MLCPKGERAQGPAESASVRPQSTAESGSHCNANPSIFMGENLVDLAADPTISSRGDDKREIKAHRSYQSPGPRIARLDGTASLASKEAILLGVLSFSHLHRHWTEADHPRIAVILHSSSSRRTQQDAYDHIDPITTASSSQSFSFPLLSTFESRSQSYEPQGHSSWPPFQTHPPPFRSTHRWHNTREGTASVPRWPSVDSWPEGAIAPTDRPLLTTETAQKTTPTTLHMPTDQPQQVEAGKNKNSNSNSNSNKNKTNDQQNNNHDQTTAIIAQSLPTDCTNRSAITILPPAAEIDHQLPRIEPLPVTTGLTLSDVSSELFQPRLDFDKDTSKRDKTTDPCPPIAGRNSNLTTAVSPSIAPRSPVSNPATPSSATASPSTQTAATSQSSTPTSTSIQPRRPSPGLAARLKALGFGSSKSRDPSPVAAHQDRVGRLPQDQIRQLDKRHQAGSLSSIIERRGRPWKGPAATAATSEATNHITPKTKTTATSTLTSLTPASAPAPTPAVTDEIVAPDASTPVPGSTTAPLLPEITTSEPLDLDMDTQKYRLPDHTNGNGTKVQLETRQEHVERCVNPPLPDEYDDDEYNYDDDTSNPPPPPLPKDTPPTTTPAEFTPDIASYFTPNRQRPGSIYTLSRASFANQLAQLTSLQLPDAGSLSSKVSAIPTANVASKALINAAEQIRSWISKASEVIAGLDSEDDVEWAAAGGREGLAEVENAAARFEELINAYVSAIEELQNRDDIASVPADDLRRAVAQMESIISEWANIQSALGNVKEQVEIAMEWEELWNMVLGDIQGEMDELCRLVFEMEERRHKSLMATTTGDGVDIGDLETIVEETPPPSVAKLAPRTRSSLPVFPVTPSSPNTPTLSQDDSSLLALFARMQPLRASLDFLPMRLSVFEARARLSFPTACDELEMRRAALDGTYKKLEKDAESLRKELGEDRWVLVFRGAGRQAQKMIESVERSLLKLKESVDSGIHLTSPPVMAKKVESYDAKKTHYGPAIERVLTIVDKGVQERLTVNGEIIRLNAELQSKWESLKVQIKEMDVALEEIQWDNHGQQLRDSVSSMLSNDRSTIGSTHDTPGSSPPSSVIMSSLGLGPVTPTPRTKVRSGSTNSNLPQPSNRRQSNVPTPNSQTRRPLASRLSSAGPSNLPTPSSGSKVPRPVSTLPSRPKWNGSTNTADAGIGHNFKPLTLTTPSPYAKRTPLGRSASSLTPTSGGGGAATGSRIPSARSPLNRSTSASPMPEDTPTRASLSRLAIRGRTTSPGPQAQQQQQQQTLAKPRLSFARSATSTTSTRRASFQPPRPRDALENSQQAGPARPASSMAQAQGRRSSMLPQMRSTTASNATTGRASPQAIAGARSAMRSSSTSDASRRAISNKPAWRP
ncbi:KAR9-domain-containing protein [Sodiomyces alkalinus F11]|uniref:KAR9-domain-containing protein n=1 Tax=Sodiomyces alkalinus (strain CBS 110278 / VKM F-3762 / F11) TaxID=1314773 RepID=A0A3N2PSH1_SODAK|nr:KAR9-domain-containing protein [Sodiomyces alkalinus F11]ROT37276.1 KAR9-domain-containing protein [Sodiomyces alkalinus F11]